MYLVLFSLNSDMDILGIVPPPLRWFDFPIFSLRNDVDNPELVAVGSKLFPNNSDVLIRLKKSLF